MHTHVYTRNVPGCDAWVINICAHICIIVTVYCANAYIHVDLSHVDGVVMLYMVWRQCIGAYTTMDLLHINTDELHNHIPM